MLKQINLLFLIILIAVNFSSIQAQDELIVPIKKIEKKAKEKYFKNSDAKVFRYENDTTIENERELDGNLLVVKGDLKIAGRINGNVLVLMGDVHILPKAYVNGDVVCVNGKIFQDEESTVTGNQIETKVKNLFPYRAWEEEYFASHRSSGEESCRIPYSMVPAKSGRKSVILNYNRVQGLFLGIKIPKKISGKYKYINVHGFLGYGFKEKRWRYQLEIDRWFFNPRKYRFELGWKTYDLVDTHDDWLISPWENTLSAMLLHKDFQDYYRRKGYEFFVGQNIGRHLKARFGYRSDRYRSVLKNTDWSLFYGKRKFRENPLIEPGRMRSLYGEIELDTRNDLDVPKKGFLVRISGESSNSKLRSDFSFNQYEFELRHYRRLSRFDRLDLRIKAATSEGTVPLQKLYQLGGISTLRGFGFKEVRGGADQFGGDRMLLANLEYNISPEILDFDFLFFGDLRYIVFFDAGNVWQRNQVSGQDSWSAGFDHLKWNDLKSDFGLGITSWSGRFRLNIARRLDTGKKPLAITVRLIKPF